MSTPLIDRFKQLDAYAKTLEDFRVKTATGAAITVTGALVMILLFLSELHTYMSPNVSEELFVDTSRGHKLRINLDIVIPSISCSCSKGPSTQWPSVGQSKGRIYVLEGASDIAISFHRRAASHRLAYTGPLCRGVLMYKNCGSQIWPDLVLDAMDSSGEQHLQMDHNIHKRRLDLNGTPIEEPQKEEFISSTSAVKKNASEVAIVTCGSCYGAALKENQCCNTCDDVKEAYKLRRWALPDLSTIEQCKDDESVEKTNMALKEGCQIYGYMEVNRVGGSFHIAPGKSFTINHVHVHDVQPYSSSVFNTTHMIQHLSFGTDIKSANTAPLDGVIGLAKEGAVMFQYYIKIVPTVYVKLDGTVLYTNQFSVTRHQKSSQVHSESGMPGAFFTYELSPLMVKYTEKERSIGHFATNICAIVGGVFTVAGIFDTLLYHSVNAFQNKILLGKTG